MAEPSSGDIWSRLSRDPRDPRAASLRASDADRDVINQVLADAFADGRLDRDEYDERSDAVLHAKTLGDFPPILSDLSPADDPPAKPKPDYHAQAEREYKRSFRQRLTGAVSSSAITTGIWGVSSMASGEFIFFWPAFVIVGTGVGVVSSFLNREDQIDTRREGLERKAERTALESDSGDGVDIAERPPAPPGAGWPSAWNGLDKEERRRRIRHWREEQRRNWRDQHRGQ